MSKHHYAPAFLRKFVGEMAQHAAGHGIGDTFVKICESFCNCGEKVAEHGAKVVAEVASHAPAAAAAGTALLGLPILGPLAVSLAIFGVTVYMKNAREAKETSEREEAFSQIKEIAAAVKNLNQKQDDAQENLVKLVERKPVWARISGGDQAAFAKRIHNEIKSEFKDLDQTLAGLSILGFDTNDRIRTVQDSINAILQSGGAFASLLNQIEAGVQALNAKIDQVLATLQSQGALSELEDRAPPRPIKYVHRPAPMQALHDALWNNRRASITGQATPSLPSPNVGLASASEFPAGGSAPSNAIPFAPLPARAAAQGDGGQGKSVLALAYAHAYAPLYPGGCYRVIVDKQSLEFALARMIPALPALQQMPQADKARLARAFLSREPRCLLIIDNVDKLTDWNDESFQALIPSGSCHVIVSTREENLPNIAPVPVGKLEEAEARQILAAFRPSAADPANTLSVNKIIRLVERLAVAVASVGALMSIGDDDNWSAYAKRLEDIPLEQYPEAHPQVIGHTGYSRRVFAALDDLYTRLPAPAQRALDYAAILPEDQIPAIDHLNGNPPTVTPADWLSILLTADADESRGDQRMNLGARPTGRPWEPADFVKKLQQLALLTPANPEHTLWTLHRLHAKRCRERLEKLPSALTPFWSAIAICAADRRDVILGQDEPGKLNAIDNPNVLTNASLRWELAPLASVAAALGTASLLKEANAVAGWLPTPLRRLGRLTEARAVLDTLLKDPQATQTAIGDTDFASLLGNLSTIQMDQGDLPEARASIERAIAIKEKHFAHDHPVLASLYSNRAMIHRAQGNLSVAGPSIERAIAIEEKHFAHDHPALATLYSNRALVQRDQGDLHAARASIERAIAIYEKHLCHDHPALAISYSNLALFQQDQGNLSAARASIERAIAIYEKHFAHDHANLGPMYSNLALIQRDQGDLHAARASIERASSIDEKHFVPDHPTFATRYSNLATIQQDLGDLPAARASIERAISIREKHFAPDHPALATLYSNLATIQQDQGDLPAARASIDRAISTNEKHFAPDHPTFATMYNNLALICFAEGDAPAACAHFKTALAILLTHLDENHPSVKTVRKSMAIAACAP